MKTIVASMMTLGAVCAVSVVAAGCAVAPAESGDDASELRGPAATRELTESSPLRHEDGVTPESDIIFHRSCNAAACTAAGGSCNFFFGCVDGCENSPVSCTATVTNAINGFGWLNVSCTGIGNGVYTVSETAAPPTETGLGSIAPSGPWFGYSPYSASAYPYVFQGQPIQFLVDEDDIYLPGCDNGYNPSNCQIHATYVQVCAQPGSGQFTAQSGVCSGNLENFDNQQCVVAPVVYQ